MLLLFAGIYVAIRQADAQVLEFGHVTRRQSEQERASGAQQQDAELEPSSRCSLPENLDSELPG